jgi:hypothetical protein
MQVLLKVVSVLCTAPVVIVTRPTDDCALLRAKCATYSGRDGSLLLVQDVSIADDFVMVIVTLTNSIARTICRLCFLAAEMRGNI